MIKKIGASALAFALMLIALTGCSSTPANIATYEGGEIPAGVYIFTQYSSYSTYQNYLGAGNILSQKMSDGKTLEEMITAEANDSMKRYASTEAECKRLGIELDEEDIASAKQGAKDSYEESKETLNKKGVSLSSIEKLGINNALSYRLFEKLYGEGGELEVPLKEKEDYLTSTYRKLTFIDFPLTDAEGKALEGDALTNAKKEASDYFAAIEGGRDFFEVYKEVYTKRGNTFAETDTAKTNSTILKVTDNRVPKEFVMKVFANSENSKPMYFEAEGHCYIFEVYDILEDNFIENVGVSLLYEMKDEAFRAYLVAKADEVGFKFDDSALKAYSLKKIANR